MGQLTYPIAFLGLGSNVGDRSYYLNSAVERITQWGILLHQSDWIETPAWGNTDQHDFLNGVIALQPQVGPWKLMQEVLAIETEFGRKREIKWGPRTLDIDILAFGDWQVHSLDLTLPHPYCTVRDFVLKPWAQIAPDFRLHGKTIREWEKLNLLTS